MEFYNYKPIRLIELFAGIGSQAKALKNLGIDFEHWYVCEFDKYAIRSYNAIHNTNFNTSDVTKITASDLRISDTEHFTYLLTYSFPCQDLSNAGKGRGMEKGSGTRSGLLWEVERLLNECTELPQVLLMENVPQVHGTKNKDHFDKWIKFLESKGYSNHWKDLNAKEYGIPQNRNRCFMVSILGDYSFEFPKGVPLDKRLRDVLEEEVDESFYLTAKQLNYAIDLYDVQKGTKWEGRCDNGKLNPNIASTLGVRSAGGNQRIGVSTFVIDGTDEEMTTKDYKTRVKQIGQLYDARNNPQSGRVYDANGTCPIIDTCSGGNRMPKVAEPVAYDEQNGYIRKDGCVGTLTTDGSSPKHNNRIVENNLRIRKLTPLESWRLMGFDDVDFHKAEQLNSNSQLYKQAGNSIVVNVLMAIFNELLTPKKTRSEWLDELLGGGL